MYNKKAPRWSHISLKRLQFTMNLTELIKSNTTDKMFANSYIGSSFFETLTFILKQHPFKGIYRKFCNASTVVFGQNSVKPKLSIH